MYLALLTTNIYYMKEAVNKKRKKKELQMLIFTDMLNVIRVLKEKKKITSMEHNIHAKKITQNCSLKLI